MSKESSFEQIELKTKIRIFKFIYTLALVQTCIIFPIIIFYYNQPVTSQLIAIPNITLSLVALFSLHKNTILIPQIICFFLCAILMPYHFYISGAGFSRSVIWLGFLLVWVYFTLPKKVFVLTSALWILTIIVSSIFPPSLGKDFFSETSMLIRNLTTLFGLITLISTLYFIDQAKQLLRNEITELEKLRSLRSIFHTTAHDIINPLTVIIGNTSLIEGRSENIDNYLKPIYQASEEIQKIVNDLKNLSKDDLNLIENMNDS